MKNLNYFKNLFEAEDNTGATADSAKSSTDIEKGEEDVFIELFSDESFLDAFKNSIKQYVSENLLDDDYNSFSVLPFIEITYKDETYGISVEFESGISINIDDDGKVIENDISDVDIIKYKTPLMDNLTLMENEIGNDTIGLFVKEALQDIKNVSR